MVLVLFICSVNECGTDSSGGTVSRVATFKVCVKQQTNIQTTPRVC